MIDACSWQTTKYNFFFFSFLSCHHAFGYLAGVLMWAAMQGITLEVHNGLRYKLQGSHDGYRWVWKTTGITFGPDLVHIWHGEWLVLSPLRPVSVRQIGFRRGSADSAGDGMMWWGGRVAVAAEKMRMLRSWAQDGCLLTCLLALICRPGQVQVSLWLC